MLRSILLLPVLLLCVACGGTSGTSTNFVSVPSSPLAHLFTGEYVSIGVRGIHDGGPEEFATSWGTVRGDGIRSTMTITHRNRLGNIVFGTGGSGSDYAVEADRRMTLESPFAGLEYEQGAISETGDLAVLAAAHGGSAPTIQLLGKPTPGMDDASLNGWWRYCAFGARVAGASNIARWGTINFDGAGGATAWINQNEEGVLFGPAGTNATYALASDGRMSLRFVGEPELSGALVADGGAMLFAGGVSPGDDPWLVVVMPLTVGLSDADLDGTYRMVGIEQFVGSSEYRSFIGGLHADGLGNVDFDGLQIHEYELTGQAGGSGTYTLAGDGELNLTPTGLSTLVGGMTQDGKFGVFTGPAGPGANPALYVLLR